MEIILGIDVGGSTTKLVGLTGDGETVDMLQVEASDQLTSAFGAFGKFIANNKLHIGDIKQIMLTGVGASHIHGGMYGIPSKRVDEFKAVGLGGLHLAGLEEALIVSMGTGTALVKVMGGKITHLGGSGVGGGTLLKLCGRFAGASTIETITQLAAQGNLRAVDLTLADISTENIGVLPPSVTVSNFGNLKDTATNADIVLGILNMIFESIGMMAIFAALNGTVHDVVLTGSLTTIAHSVNAERAFGILSDIFGPRFHIPPNAIYATALGAALSIQTFERGE
jgi:type II pantothenate kinase